MWQWLCKFRACLLVGSGLARLGQAAQTTSRQEASICVPLLDAGINFLQSLMNTRCALL